MRKTLFIGVLILAFLMFTFIQPSPAKADPVGVAAAIAGGIIFTAAIAAACYPYYAYPPPGPAPWVAWGPPPPGPQPWGPQLWAPWGPSPPGPAPWAPWGPPPPGPQPWAPWGPLPR